MTLRQIAPAVGSGPPPRDKEPDQRRILSQGNEYLEKEFPQLDFVKKATIVPAPAAR